MKDTKNKSIGPTIHIVEDGRRHSKPYNWAEGLTEVKFWFRFHKYIVKILCIIAFLGGLLWSCYGGPIEVHNFSGTNAILDGVFILPHGSALKTGSHIATVQVEGYTPATVTNDAAYRSISVTCGSDGGVYAGNDSYSDSPTTYVRWGFFTACGWLLFGVMIKTLKRSTGNTSVPEV